MAAEAERLRVKCEQKQFEIADKAIMLRDPHEQSAQRMKAKEKLIPRPFRPKTQFDSSSSRTIKKTQLPFVATVLRTFPSEARAEQRNREVKPAALPEAGLMKSN